MTGMVKTEAEWYVKLCNEVDRWKKLKPIVWIRLGEPDTFLDGWRLCNENGEYISDFCWYKHIKIERIRMEIGLDVEVRIWERIAGKSLERAKSESVDHQINRFCKQHPELDLVVWAGNPIVVKSGLWRERLCKECAYCGEGAYCLKHRKQHYQSGRLACPDFVPREIPEADHGK